MKKYFFLLSVLCTISFFGQNSPDWSACFGNIGDDDLREVKKTADGGCIVVGTYDSSYCLIAKVDASGTIEWQKTYRHTTAPIGQTPAKAYSVAQTTDGGYIFTGYNSGNGDIVTDNHGQNDCWVVKVDSLGNIVWQKSLGGAGYECGNSIKVTSDGGYIVAGYSTSNDGDVTGNHGERDFWIVKLNNTGTIAWQKSLGGSQRDEATSIQQTTDGGYIVSGNSYSSDGDVTNNSGLADFWVVKLSAIGSIQWQKSFGNNEYQYEATTIQTSDGGYITAGTTFETISGGASIRRGLVIKLNNLGIVEWQRTIGYDPSLFNSIIQTIDGGYAIIGTTILGDGSTTIFNGNSNMWFLKLSSDGSTEGQQAISGGGDEFGLSIDQMSTGEYFIAGYARTTCGTGQVGGDVNFQGWVAKLRANILNQTDNVLESPISIYPIPTSNLINVKISSSFLNSPYAISDQTGRIVVRGNLNEENTTISIESLSSGIYIFSTGEQHKINTKIVKD